MQVELVDIVCCSECGGKIALEKVEKKVNDNIVEGSIKCRDCGTIFEIRHGILDMLRKIDTELAHEIEHWNAFATGSKKHPAAEDLREKFSLLTYDLFARAIHRYLPRRDSVVVLEVGCGTSETIELMRLNAKKVIYIGVDVSTKMLLNASRRRRNDWTVNLIRGDANKNLLREGAADVAVSAAALHHLDLEEALRGISASLKEDGLLMLHEPNRLNFFARVGRRVIKDFYTKEEKPLSPVEVKKIAESCGLTFREQKGVSPVGQFYAYFVGLVSRSNPTLAKMIRAFDKTVVYTDDLLQKTPLSNILSAAFFQVYEKKTV